MKHYGQAVSAFAFLALAACEPASTPVTYQSAAPPPTENAAQANRSFISGVDLCNATAVQKKSSEAGLKMLAINTSDGVGDTNDIATIIRLNESVLYLYRAVEAKCGPNFVVGSWGPIGGLVQETESAVGTYERAFAYAQRDEQERTGGTQVSIDQAIGALGAIAGGYVSAMPSSTPEPSSGGTGGSGSGCYITLEGGLRQYGNWKNGICVTTIQ